MYRPLLNIIVIRFLKRDINWFSSSAGAWTTPFKCIFSSFPRHAYSYKLRQRKENLLPLKSKVGITPISQQKWIKVNELSTRCSKKLIICQNSKVNEKPLKKNSIKDIFIWEHIVLSIERRSSDKWKLSQMMET